MHISAKANLQTTLSEWLSKEHIADSLGGISGIWQDNTAEDRNAQLLANACEVVIDAMELQSILESRLNPNE